MAKRYITIKERLLVLIHKFQKAEDFSDTHASYMLTRDTHFIKRLRKPGTGMTVKTADRIFKQLAKYDA